MENEFVSSESILSRTSLCLYFVGWKIYLLLGFLIFVKRRTEQIWLYLENYLLMYFIQKLEVKINKLFEWTEILFSNI